MRTDLRPIERVILRLQDQDLATVEIAHRVGKRPGTVIRILDMIGYKDGVPPRSGRREESRLRPLERVVLKLRDRGESYGLIGNRLARSGNQIRRIERYAGFKS